MITFIQKVIVLWEKKKFLTLMELESGYLNDTHSDIIYRDIDSLRAKLGKLREKKDASNEDQRTIITVEAEINETEKIRQMMKSSEEKSADLRKQISFYKKGLWK